ncbi:mucin-3B-like [Sphaeramia orbicularis]|uniref:mucin-3B-like n=1 Tax=Sphaeramia orbicularis TaxID=375764 RepID=UPI00117CBF85|nr:mucin-3B-like [Sphaeramia orbicularis]
MPATNHFTSTSLDNNTSPTSTVSTSTVPTVSTLSSTTKIFPNTTVTGTIPSTTPRCPDSVYGDECIYGVNDTSPNIDPGTLPSRKVNVTLKIDITFVIAFENLNSPEAITFIKGLLSELEPLCFEADPSTFKKVKVVKLSSGSVIADTEVEYIYPNNQTQINFVNDHLDGVLTGILNDTTNLKKIASAVNATSAQLNNVTFQAPNITNITQLEPFINCSNFVDYTPELSNGQWECVGPCKTHPNYCNRHGDCYNNIYKGPICKCYSSSLEQYSGPQCDLFRYGPGFYGALFGSLAGALLLLIIIVIAVLVKKRHSGMWKRSNSYDRRLSAFEEDFFDFSHTGDHNLGFAGTYTPQGFRPHAENVAGVNTSSRGF